MRFRTIAAPLLALLSSQTLAYAATNAPRYTSPEMYRPKINAVIIRGKSLTESVDNTSVTRPDATTTRSLVDRFRELPLTPADFTAGSCSNAADDTCSIQAAINAACLAGASELALPKPTYAASNIVIPTMCKGLTFRGLGVRGTLLQSSILTQPILTVQGLGIRVSGLSLIYNGTPTTGADALVWKASSSFLREVFISNADRGIVVQDGSINFLSDFVITNCKSNGIYVTNSLDAHFRGFVIDADTATNGSEGNIRLQDYSEAVTFDTADVLNGAYSLVTAAISNVDKARPAHNRFTNVYFDSAARGSVLRVLYGTRFDGGWFSGGRSGSGYPGVTIMASIDTVTFAGVQFFNSGSHGATVRNGAKRVVFTAGWSAQGNGVTSGPGTANGLNFESGVTDFIITAGISNSVAPYGSQSFGVAVADGASNRYVIQGNLLSGNRNGPIYDAGTGPNKTVNSNY